MEDNHSCDTSLGYLKACQSVIDDGVIRQKDMNLATKLARFGLLSRYSLRDGKWIIAVYLSLQFKEYLYLLLRQIATAAEPEIFRASAGISCLY